jgi:hypothetical protein
MNERLARHLISRLWRKARAEALEHAEEAGLIEKQCRDSCGRELRVFRRRETGAEELSAEQVASIVRSHRKRLGSEYIEPVAAKFKPEPEGQERDCIEVGPIGEFPSSTAHLRGLDEQLVRFVRAAAEPPKASDVAAVLLVAQSLSDESLAHRKLLQVLSQSRPIITILGQAEGFERTFIDLLVRGQLLPGEVARCNGYELLSERDRDFRFQHVLGAKWKVVTFAGLQWNTIFARDRIAMAAPSAYPVLGIAETPARLPARIVEAAHLNLSCGKLNADIVRRTFETVLGEAPPEGLEDIDFAKIEITDLALAIRPGIAASRAVATLRKFAALPDDASSDVAGNDDDNPSGSNTGSSSPGSDAGSGTLPIQPAKESDLQAPWVERLTGYGEAQEWALALKEDLALWKAGTLDWEEMSTRVLLYGPPGTGKTMFARALANSLQLPLIATSVASWLEQSYLGEVLRQMGRTFRFAQIHKPVILFIDEIDGIGTRRDSVRDHANYWNQIVNQFLELLDGSLKTDGVIIVGATNNQSAIDPAVLRSGRLERHVQIALPDVEALAGILRHHLRDDLETVVAGAPAEGFSEAPSETDLQQLANELAGLPDDILRRLAE